MWQFFYNSYCNSLLLIHIQWTLCIISTMILIWTICILLSLYLLQDLFRKNDFKDIAIFFTRNVFALILCPQILRLLHIRYLHVFDLLLLAVYLNSVSKGGMLHSVLHQTVIYLYWTSFWMLLLGQIVRKLNLISWACNLGHLYPQNILLVCNHILEIFFEPCIFSLGVLA